MKIEIPFAEKEIDTATLLSLKEKDSLVARDKDFLEFLVTNSFEKNPVNSLEKLLPLDPQKRSCFLHLENFTELQKLPKASSR